MHTFALFTLALMAPDYVGLDGTLFTLLKCLDNLAYVYVGSFTPNGTTCICIVESHSICMSELLLMFKLLPLLLLLLMMFLLLPLLLLSMFNLLSCCCCCCYLINC